MLLLRRACLGAGSEATESPANFDAALDAPEPDECEDGGTDQDVEDGEDVGKTGRRGDEELRDVHREACCIDSLKTGTCESVSVLDVDTAPGLRWREV